MKEFTLALFFLLIFSVPNLLSQETELLLTKGEDASNRENFNEAIYYFNLHLQA
jgi:hypothetical protein